MAPSKCEVLPWANNGGALAEASEDLSKAEHALLEEVAELTAANSIDCAEPGHVYELNPTRQIPSSRELLCAPHQANEDLPSIWNEAFAPGLRPVLATVGRARRQVLDTRGERVFRLRL